MFFMISLNESFASVYLVGVFIILILHYMQDAKDLKFWDYFKPFLIALGILIFTVVLESIVAMIVLKLSNITVPSVANNAIRTYGSILFRLKMVAIGIFYKYIMAARWYFPATILVIAVGLSLIMAVYLAIKNKKGIVLLLMLGLLLSILSLSVVMGRAASYRSCTTFAPFIAFILMLVAMCIHKRFWHVLYITLFVLLIVNQVRILNDWFVNDYNRYQHDKAAALDIALEIEEDCDISKPLVFIGELSPAPQTTRVEINGKSFLGWASGTDQYTRRDIFIFLSTLGHDFSIPSEAQYATGESLASRLKNYPKDGYYLEQDDFIVINLGDGSFDNIDVRQKQAFDALVDFIVRVTGDEKTYVENLITAAID